ncbi:MAG: vWA domain-containing protein [Polyangiaceae bacterium]|nr:vWA domain-containing protein [Polyangiaceae bacterium]
MHSRFLLWCAGVASLALCFCQSEKPPAYFDLSRNNSNASTGGAAPGDVGFEIPPPRPPDINTMGLCVNEVTPVAIEAPNLYFVLDRSGSMLEPLANSQLSKYRAAEVAIVEMLRKIGHRVRYGATIFPAPNSPTGCGAGVQILEAQRGDPYSADPDAEDGPVLQLFIDKLNRSAPPVSGSGGTPTAATLAALVDPLAALPGSTVAVLVTDGAPNCNAKATCDQDNCIANIVLGPTACGLNVNCCSTQANGSPEGCFDQEPTRAAVKSLADRGIQTFVVGMPGSEAFTTLLNQLAVLGGTARSMTPATPTTPTTPTTPDYYSVNDTQALGNALLEIGASLAQSCEVALSKAPPDPALVNVFLDLDVIGQSETNGWTWNGTSALTLRGDACDRVKLGNVQQIQVVAGCPTVLR